MGHFLQVGLFSPNLQRSSLAVAYCSNSWHPGHNSLLPSFFLQYKRIICSTTRCSSFILFIFLCQERIKRSQQFGFIYHTACAPQYFSVAEEHQRRHGLDAVLACCYAVLIYIHLDDSNAVAQYTLYLLQNGVHRLARLAPCSKEIDQNKLATVYYIIECLVLLSTAKVQTIFRNGFILLGFCWCSRLDITCQCILVKKCLYVHHANIVQEVKTCYKMKINYRESKSCFYGFFRHQSHPCQPSKPP